MPDDETTQGDQVAEQEVAAEVDDQTTSDKLSDEEAAFSGESNEGDEGSELGLEKDTDAEEKQEKKDKPEDTGLKGTESKDKTDDGDKDGLEDLDDDSKRGRELIDAQKAFEESQRKEQEAKEAERAEKEESEDKQDPKYLIDSYDNKNIELLNSSIPDGLFPDDPVELPNGQKLDFKSVVSDYPEFPTMVAGIANHVVRNMMSTGFLASGDGVKRGGQDILKAITQQLFVHDVTHPEYGVENAKEIAESKEFKEWYEKQKDEIKVLGRSKKAKDHVRLLKRYLNNEIVEKLEKDATEKDNKRRKKKKNFDDIHKVTPKSGKPSKPRGAVDTKSDEEEAFLSEDDDDDFIYR